MIQPLFTFRCIPYLLGEFQPKYSARRGNKGCDLFCKTVLGKVENICCLLFT